MPTPREIWAAGDWPSLSKLVVIHGEAAMLSAQVAGPEKSKMGMNVDGYDNKQYTLNLMHWLTGVLREK